MSKFYAVFHNGRQVSKAHSTLDAAATEAFEIGEVVMVKGNKYTAPGWEIKEAIERRETETP